MGAGEGQPFYLRWCLPGGSGGGGRGGRAGGKFGAVGFQQNAVAGDRVPDAEEGSAGQYFEGSDRRTEIVRVDIHFDIGKFPQAGIDHAGGTPPHQQACPVADDQGNEPPLGDGRPRRRRGKFVYTLPAQGEAVAAQGAGRALGLAGKANQGAQLHHGLVQPGRLAAGDDQGFGRPPEFCFDSLGARIARDAQEAAQDPDHIAVENGRGLVEGDAANRARRVSAHAGQSQHFVKRFGEAPGMLIHDQPGRGMGEAHAAIITEALPQFEHALRPRLGEVRDRWQRPHPALVVGDHCFDLRLLQHDFGNPDGVGIARPAPGQVARMLVKPAHPFPGEASHGAATLKPKAGACHVLEERFRPVACRRGPRDKDRDNNR